MNSLKHLSEDDKPREKLLKLGENNLSNSELIAILIGSGSREHNAIELSRIILKDNQNSLDNLAKLSIKELTKYKGIGEAKAITIASALEIGRRRKTKDSKDQTKITCSHDAYEQLHPIMMDLNHEEFWVFHLSRANKILKLAQISIGGSSSTIADPKIIFKQALDHKAQGIIIAHNHPSGSLIASEADKKLTQKIKNGGSLLDIPLLDHIIYTNNAYFSFADEQLI